MTDAREPAEGTGRVEDAADDLAKHEDVDVSADGTAAEASREDDLLDDLNGILEEGASGLDDAGGVEESEEEFDELDAFLEEFEQQQMKEAAGALDQEDQQDPASAEAAQAPTPSEEATVEEVPAVSDDDAFEAMAATDEAAPAEPAREDEAVPAEAERKSETPAAPEELDLAFDEEEPAPEAETSAPTDALEMAAASAAAAQRRGERRGGLARVAVAAVALLGLAGAAVAVLLSYSVDQRLTSLAAAVSRVEQRPAPASQPDELAKEALSEVRRVSQRVRELAVIVEGPMGHMRDSTDRQFKAVAARLDDVEARLNTLKEKLVAAKPTVSAKAVPTKAAAKPTAAKESAAKPATSTAPKGEWVINLASYTNEKVADAGLERLREAGFKPVKQTVQQQGTTWYRLRVGGFASRAEAEAYGRQVGAKTRFKGMWVSKQ